MSETFILDNLMRYVGQTVTIFTTSGGLSGDAVIIGTNILKLLYQKEYSTNVHAYKSKSLVYIYSY